MIERIKNGELDKYQKQKLYEIVINMKDATDNQKRRFLLYYQLMPEQNKKETLADIAKEKKCSSNAVRYSVLRLINKLVNLKDEKDLQILKELSGIN